MRYCISYYFLNVDFDRKSYGFHSERMIHACRRRRRYTHVIIMTNATMHSESYAKHSSQHMPAKAIRISFTKNWMFGHWMDKRICLCAATSSDSFPSTYANNANAYSMLSRVHCVEAKRRLSHQQSRNIRIFDGKNNNMCCVHQIGFNGVESYASNVTLAFQCFTDLWLLVVVQRTRMILCFRRRWWWTNGARIIDRQLTLEC